jgi:hypothetical protein
VKAAAAVLVVSVTIAGLTGCASSNDATPSPSGTAASSVAPTTAASAGATSTQTDGLSDGTDIPTAEPADSTSTAAAVTVADKLMTAFARPHVDATTWINGLYPYITQQAGSAYAGTDPAKVPVNKVTGPGAVVDGATQYALLVKVPTDRGDYVVSLTRKAPTDPWLAERVTPPTR